MSTELMKEHFRHLPSNAMTSFDHLPDVDGHRQSSIGRVSIFIGIVHIALFQRELPAAHNEDIGRRRGQWSMCLTLRPWWIDRLADRRYDGFRRSSCGISIGRFEKVRREYLACLSSILDGTHDRCRCSDACTSHGWPAEHVGRIHIQLRRVSRGNYSARDVSGGDRRLLKVQMSDRGWLEEHAELESLQESSATVSIAAIDSTGEPISIEDGDVPMVNSRQWVEHWKDKMDQTMNTNIGSTKEIEQNHWRTRAVLHQSDWSHEGSTHWPTLSK